MNYTAFVVSLYQVGAIKFGSFTLKSGKSSKIYLDLRQIISYPSLLKTVTGILWKKIKDCDFEIICGVPYTALPIATGISLQHNVPMVLRRKEKKSYGTKQQVEGVFKAGQRCLVIEDIVTTGSSIIETVIDLEEAGLKVTDAIVLIDRGQGGKENLQQHQYTLHSAFTLQEILHTLLSSTKLSQEECDIINTLI